MKNESLQEVNSSVDTTQRKTALRRFLSFLGPAYLVSVGYMDPGNWATDIAGGSRFGYALIWVLVLSNLMALLLQSLSARLGIVSGLDLAQASRAAYPKPVNLFLWFLAEIAIAATDLAEVIGMAIGIQLLFDIPLLYGVFITVFDTFLLLFLQRYGIRKMEAFIVGLISIIGFAFLIQLIYAKPSVSAIAGGIIPSLPGDGALYIAIGIIGATVMPHNLYLHSSLVQTRKIDLTPKGILRAIRYNIIDSAIALNLALSVNAAILILAAAAFYNNNLTEVTSIHDAHHLLGNVLGSEVAPKLFAIALIAAGQSSTLTGTLSGQIVMEGYLNLRLQPWIRRIITRLVAVVPAVITIVIGGEHMTEELLILSQVILSLQLGFAVIPLIHFTSSKKMMGNFKAPRSATIAAWICAIIIVGLNIRLVIDTMGEWIRGSEHPLLLSMILVPVAALTGTMLIWITVKPFIDRNKEKHLTYPHQPGDQIIITEKRSFSCIAVCVDFSDTDTEALSYAISQGGKDAEYLLIHITETAGARVSKGETEDFETTFDREMLLSYQKQLSEQGYQVKTALGFGNPKESIPEIINSGEADILVMGAHGHSWLKDLLLGTTVEAVRHKIKIPLLIVRKNKKK
ncbi:MAG: Nramp family divalent metal transporter [Bacteroidia bacterium]